MSKRGRITSVSWAYLRKTPLQNSNSPVLPAISESEHTPVVEKLLAIIQRLKKEISGLKEENCKLKKLNTPSKFKKRSSATRKRNSIKPYSNLGNKIDAAQTIEG